MREDSMATVAPTDADIEVARELLGFIKSSPSMFHSARTACGYLERAGFERLAEGGAWDVRPGGRYFVTRNGSSVIALSVGADAATADGLRFQVAASHSDSPTFKLKAAPELDGPCGSRRLDVEAYGGMIDYTWFDRPLALAGRVLVRTPDGIESRLVETEREVAIIPSLAVHLDRSVNDSFSPNRAVDLCPVITAGALGAGAVGEMLAEAAGARAADVLSRDVFLVNRQEPLVWGAAREFISSPKLDDLMCAFTSLKAFLASDNPSCVGAWCMFDNEEVGSNTKQGAMSTFLADTLRRATGALGLDGDAYRRALSRSMMVSCDNAHAVHPNRPEKYDEANRCRLNGGIVIKEAANQHYCTDAFSRAVLEEVLDRAGVPWQVFANRSDMAGGSTLGNLSNIQASMHAVDVGCPQLAMHSSFETAGTADVALAIRALRAFFEADIRIDGAESARIG